METTKEKKKRIKPYTIEDAARDVASSMTPGKVYPGYRICSLMRIQLRRKGHPGRPMDTVCLARFREIKSTYRIDAQQGISEYRRVPEGEEYRS